MLLQGQSGHDTHAATQLDIRQGACRIAAVSDRQNMRAGRGASRQHTSQVSCVHAPSSTARFLRVTATGADLKMTAWTPAVPVLLMMA